MNHPINLTHYELLCKAPTGKDVSKYNTLRQFIWQHPANRTWFLSIVVFGIISFAIFKWFYPQPDFFSDSYSYIYAAEAGLDCNVWPIGYSKFLVLLHYISHSDVFVVWTQQILYLLSTLYFFFTFLFLVPFRKEAKIILALFLFSNPIMFYLANYITSDILFCSLSLLWITECLWLLHRPQKRQYFTLAALVFLAFTVRYNAMYYPLITAVVIMFAKGTVRKKIAGIALPWILIVPFILYSRDAAKKLTGTAQFPILSGWQWGNNALYIYEHIDVDSNILPTPEAKELNRRAMQFFKVTPYAERDLPNYVANYFIRMPAAPLKTYLNAHFPFKSDYQQAVSWGKASPIFKDFGLSIIRDHKLAYLRYFMLMNTRNYFLPPLEKLDIYNLGLDKVWKPAVRWFQWEDPEVYPKLNPEFQGSLLAIYPALFCLLNCYFVFLLLKYLAKMPHDIHANSLFNFLLVTSLFFALNFAFSIFANIIVIRYQIFPMLLFFSLCVTLVELVELNSQVLPNPNLKTAGHRTFL